MWWWFLSQALADDVCATRPGVLTQTACTEADPLDCLYAPNRPAGTFTRYPASGSITLVDPDALAQPNRPVPVIVNVPDAAAGPLPIVILSHGGPLGVLNPANVMQEWFGELPKWGYVTITVAHTPRNVSQSNALCSALAMVTPCPVGQPYDRPQDISTVIDWLTGQQTNPASPLYGKLDLDRIGVLGHSAGAGGAALIDGMKRVFGYRADGSPVYLPGPEPRVKALVALSPPGLASSGVAADAYLDVHLPAFVVSGAGDDGGELIAAPYGDRTAMYDLGVAPEQYRLFLDHPSVRHDTVNLKWLGTCTQTSTPAECLVFTAWIGWSSLAFLDAYLQCDDRAAAWLESDGVTVASGGIAQFEKRPALDSDADGVVDGLDACPGADDALDADGDGTPDACDACPDDALNDRDGDGACDSDDVCPLDRDDDADLDGQCADVDPCPLDPLDDADLDGVCADVDPCPDDPANDADGDGVCGDDDRCPGADDRFDADADGSPDACDLCPFDPFNDRDGDGACDGVDPCPLDPEDDADFDGACADVDPCPLDPVDDADADGMCADVDPCPVDLENDADGDGLCASDDVCPTVADPAQGDADLDGIGDACEPDADSDGVVDDTDDCPYSADPAQLDLDGDGVGDVCDADADGDAVPDGQDACLGTAAGAPVLLDGCAVAQTCACAAPWKNHGAYVSCVARAADALVSLGRITGADKGAIVSAAGQSSCGASR